MKALLLTLALLVGAASAQSFTVALNWDGGPVGVGVQVLGSDAIDIAGLRVAPSVQLRARVGREFSADLYSGVQVFYLPDGQRWAMSASVLWRVGWTGERFDTGPSVGVVWTWRP